MVGNPEVIREQAPRKSLHGFRSCLTHSASSSVAQSETCRTTLARRIMEGLPVIRQERKSRIARITAAMPTY
jgi:hypothetical protein